MIHWSDSGTPLTEGHDDAEIIWGDPPAAAIEEGLQRLIARLYAELRHHPTVADIDEQTSAPPMAPEIIEAIADAANVFREDVGRYPTRAEAQAGLVLADTQAALFTYLEREIQVGDRVLWAEYDDNGKFLQQTRDGHDDTLVFACGIVTAQPDGWHGDNTITRDDGRTAVIGRKWLIRLPDREQAVDTVY